MIDRPPQDESNLQHFHPPPTPYQLVAHLSDGTSSLRRYAKLKDLHLVDRPSPPIPCARLFAERSAIQLLRRHDDHQRSP